MAPKLTVEEEALVEKNMRSEQVLREWGIWQVRRNERAALVAYVIVSLATLAGIACYLVFTEPLHIYRGISGFFIVIGLAIVTMLLRAFQLKVQRKNCERLLDELRKNLTGSPERDTAIQDEIVSAADWGARRLDWAGYMIAIAMLAIAIVNIAQGGFQDLGRSMVYIGCLAIFALGHVWHVFKTSDLVLTTALQARLEASIHNQRRNMRTERFERVDG